MHFNEGAARRTSAAGQLGGVRLESLSLYIAPGAGPQYYSPMGPLGYPPQGSLTSAATFSTREGSIEFILTGSEKNLPQ